MSDPFDWPRYVVQPYALPVNRDVSPSCRGLRPIFVPDLIEAVWAILKQREELHHAFIGIHIRDGRYRDCYAFDLGPGPLSWRDLGDSNAITYYEPSEVDIA